MIARFFYRLFLKLFARRIVRAAYQGVLGRPADDEGLAAYARELAARRDLTYILNDMVQSEEAQNRFRGNGGAARPGYRPRAMPRP